MPLRPADPSDLEAVRTAAAEFRAHWERIRPPFDCPFHGTIDDVHALDYLDYEGIGYSQCGEAGAALIWGNVVATQLPLSWYVDDALGGLILYTGDLQAVDTPLAIWPFGRVYESRWGKETQFDKYQWLLDQVILQLLGHDLLGPTDRGGLVALMTDHESWCAARMWDHALSDFFTRPGSRSGASGPSRRGLG